MTRPYLTSSVALALAVSEATSRLQTGQVFLSPQSFLFVPIALETLTAIAPGSLEFLTEMGQRWSAATGDAREIACLFQRIRSLFIASMRQLYTVSERE